MARTTHLKAMQALEMAIREGSLQAAASRLGITPAAVGQRIRALEEFLGADLLLRGRSGLQPTQALAGALSDLHAAFAALDRVADRLDFQRTAEIHVVADADWSDLWLLPRLHRFRAEHPNILFNINGEGDVPMRLGAADIVIGRDREGSAGSGEPLYTECFVPVATPEIVERLADPANYESERYLPIGAIRADRRWRLAQGIIEGFPLLHIIENRAEPAIPGWQVWMEAFGYRRSAPGRGVRYAHLRNALDGTRSNAGMLICGLSCVLDEVEAGALRLPFPGSAHLVADWPYCVRARPEARARPQVARFRDWLFAESAMTRLRMDKALAG